MNLQQAHTMSQLSLPVMKKIEKVQSSTKVAYGILARCEKGGYPYEHFPVNNKGAKNWAHKFLTSKEFVLKRINLNAAAAPHNPRDPKRVKFYIKQLAASRESYKNWDPLIVDMNKLKAGRTLLGYIPDVIFVDGKHRRKAMLACGVKEHWAWVGTKALKKLNLKDMKASESSSDTEIYLPPVDGTKIASQYEMMCSTVPAMNIPTNRQDTGSGGARPVDHMHSNKKKKVNAGGPGSGPRETGRSSVRHDSEDDPKCKTCGEHESEHSQYGGYCPLGTNTFDKTDTFKACGAVSTGQLDPASASDDKVPPDQSDSGSNVSASDQRKWEPDKPQMVPGGLNPNNAYQYGVNKAADYSNNIGPRVRNKGASRSEMSRTLEAGGPGSGRHQVVFHNNALGSKGPSIVSTHPTKEEAQAKAKRMNSILSPGEKKYYGLKYTVQPEKSSDVKPQVGGFSKQPAWTSKISPQPKAFNAARHMKGCSCSKCKGMAAAVKVKKMWTKKKIKADEGDGGIVRLEAKRKGGK